MKNWIRKWGNVIAWPVMLVAVLGFLALDAHVIKSKTLNAPEVLIECKTDDNGMNLACHFTNISEVVTRECVVLGIECSVDGKRSMLTSPNICSGWLTSLLNAPRWAESWSSPARGKEFPPSYATACGVPNLISHETLTAAQYIEDHKNFPLVQWEN